MVGKNVGGVDAAFRAALGSLVMVLAALAAGEYPFLALGGALVALAILVTAIAGICPLYGLLGVDTHAGARPRIQAKPEPVHQH